MIGKLGFSKFIHLQAVAILILLASCIGGEGGKKKADCSSGQVLNTVTRKCEGARIEAGPPTLTLKNISISEDSGPQTLTLSYSDTENDVVTACTVTAATSSGLRKTLESQGLRYTSKSVVTKGQYVQIQIVETGAVSVNTYTAIDGVSPDSVASDFDAFTQNYLLPGLGNPYLIYITTDFYPLSTGLTVKNAIEAHAIASKLVDVTLLTSQPIRASSAQSLTIIPCACSGGVCTTSIEPTQDFYGTTEFTYTLTDNDGTSSQTTSLTVSAVNDAPVVSTTAGTLNLTEGIDQFNFSNTISDDLGITVSDVDNSSSTIYYEMVTAPLMELSISIQMELIISRLTLITQQLTLFSIWSKTQTALLLIRSLLL